MVKRYRTIVVVSVALTGCVSLAPDYERPGLELPAGWVAPEGQDVAAVGAQWWTVYGDAQLDRLVEEALVYNADLAVAVARVDEARAQLGETRSGQFPSVDAGLGAERTRASLRTGELPPGLERVNNNYRAALGVSYELDLWGRLRDATAAARAELLATEAACDTVRIVLAADVARGYFSLRALDEQLDATRRSLATRSAALALQKLRHENGLISEFEYHQLEAEVLAARAQLPVLERSRTAQENALAVLLGRSPRAIYEGTVVESASATDQMTGRTSEASRASVSSRGPRLGNCSLRCSTSCIHAVVGPIGEAATAPSLARGPRLGNCSLRCSTSCIHAVVGPIGEAATAPSLARGPRLDPIGEYAAQAGDTAGQAPVLVVPAGMPSELLLRRPDLIESEYRLIAANARIGAARAAYFPSITLTGFYGSESTDLSDLFTGPAGVAQIAAGVTQPIWNAGRIASQVEAANARERQALALYQRAVQNAFREVRDAIVAQLKTREQFDSENQRVMVLRSALRLARLRYANGVASQLDVLDSERNLLAAELNRSDALRAQRAAVADLFKALGGGWGAGAWTVSSRDATQAN